MALLVRGRCGRVVCLVPSRGGFAAFGVARRRQLARHHPGHRYPWPECDVEWACHPDRRGGAFYAFLSHLLPRWQISIAFLEGCGSIFVAPIFFLFEDGAVDTIAIGLARVDGSSIGACLC